MQGRVYAFCDPFCQVVFGGRHEKVGVNSKEVFRGKVYLQSFYKRCFSVAPRRKQNHISLVFCMGKSSLCSAARLQKGGSGGTSRRVNGLGILRPLIIFNYSLSIIENNEFIKHILPDHIYGPFVHSDTIEIITG